MNLVFNLMSNLALVGNIMLILTLVLMLFYARVLLTLRLDETVRKGLTLDFSLYLAIFTSLWIVSIPQLGVIASTRVCSSLNIISIISSVILSSIVGTLHYRGRNNLIKDATNR